MPARLGPKAHLAGTAMALSLVTSACSADAAREPAPTLQTPGAFLARQTESGWHLHRTLSGISLTPERRLLFLASYPPELPTLAEATARAKGPTPAEPAPRLVIMELDQFLEAPVEVVWFRSLTETDVELLP